MLAKRIGSVQHPIVKKAVQLRKSAKNRKEAGQICIVGRKLIEEYASDFSIDVLFSLKTVKIPAKEHILVTDAILKKISGVLSPDQMVAIVPMPKPKKIENKKRLLILDQIQDPGNLGTLFRTALALDWQGVYLTPNTVDLFNDKVIRASKGAIFKIPFDYADYEKLDCLKKTHSWKGYLADLEGMDLETVQPSTDPICLILGSEGQGPSPIAKKGFTALHIPIHDKMESLNVAIAGAIIMYNLRIQ